MKNIIALGAENKTSFSVISEEDIYVSSPSGDLNDMDNFDGFEMGLKDYMDKKTLIPDCVACDLHPDYRSTRLAEEIKDNNAASILVRVQHHFAHVAACMLDNDLDEEVIGVSFDGTGFGTDGKSLGSEFMVCTRKDFTRKFHLKYMPQPGADVAAREPWRMAVAYLYDAYGEKLKDIGLPLLKRIPNSTALIINDMIKKDINCPLTSSMGRLFDAVSSLVGVCDVATFEAEGAIGLEEIVVRGIGEVYKYDVTNDEIDVAEMIKEINGDVVRGIDSGIISAKFHNTIGEIIFDVVERIHNATGLKKALISGGCFQNKYLVNYVEEKFAGAKIKLYKHNKYSPTDLGISVGQAVVAASLNR